MSRKAKAAADQQLDLFAWRQFGAINQSENLELPELDGVEYNLDGDGINTMIGYMYRDGGNYKQFNAVVLKGRMSRPGILKLVNALFDYVLFLASEVGLQDLQTRFENGWEIEADHPWHELRQIGYVNDAPTTDENQAVITASEFVARWPLTSEDWDDLGVEERLIEKMGISARCNN